MALRFLQELRRETEMWLKNNCCTTVVVSDITASGIYMGITYIIISVVLLLYIFESLFMYGQLI